MKTMLQCRPKTKKQRELKMFESLNSIMESYLGKIKPLSLEVTKLPFFIRCGCVKMAAPRHERFDLLRDIGSELINSVFENKEIKKVNPIFFFPERHLSVVEQQAFISALKNHRNSKDFLNIDIITSSPLIIGNFQRESILILQWNDDHKHNGTTNNN